MSARIINLHTGEVTPPVSVWSDTGYVPGVFGVKCYLCDQWLPEDDEPKTWMVYNGYQPAHIACQQWFESPDDEPDSYQCEGCGEALTEEEVDRLSADDTPRWTCDPCNERMWDDLWSARSHEAQDRAVLRGMG